MRDGEALTQQKIDQSKPFELHASCESFCPRGNKRISYTWTVLVKPIGGAEYQLAQEDYTVQSGCHILPPFSSTTDRRANMRRLHLKLITHITRTRTGGRGHADQSHFSNFQHQLVSFCLTCFAALAEMHSKIFPCLAGLFSACHELNDSLFWNFRSDDVNADDQS